MLEVAYFNDKMHIRTKESEPWVEVDGNNTAIIGEKKTLRDEFAMSALTGLLANPASEFMIKDVDVCYEAADAMLKAREE